MKFWNDKGNIAVMAALSMPVVIGGAGLGVETGYWYYEQLSLQQAADAAAYAAAIEHQQGKESDMEPSAQDAAELNGFDDAADDLTMTWPSSAFPTNNRTVEIELTREVPRAFTALFGDDPIHLRVRATARYEPSSNACMLALAPSGANAVSFAGNSNLTVSGCVVSSNSLDPNSVTSQGNASSAHVPCITTAGETNISANIHLTSCTDPLENQAPAADPYDDLPMPTPGVCMAWPNGNNAQHTPGTYCTTQQINGNKVHTFAAGTYILNGSAASLQVTGGTMIGHGVTFILMNGATVSMNGNGILDLSAPTSGTYKGMLFVGDRTGSHDTVQFNGTANSLMTGTIYFPNDNVQYNGNFSGSGGCTQVVGYTLTWSGSATVNVDCSTYGMGVIQVGGRPYLVG
jgi:hypothetical protein